ncbi:4-hydroxythreonine-4-phosphate dehydrogenase PdxA [Alteriqipengyuania sp. WL0013]|uniref:4-hydroxythreonine-4-phosphate dehydrogenase PdxA n=1 Tax=Alteriqipengyuania sp. WL0013 TaxID=3110773 RepID=UPI002C709765|nr:4-hydroxythreonine-4-phosphate dehydrogenase PdxA [Alteriqipengyuania sp. WL0013]MEB3415660.1 4-hydroxythreonine-4-phosphate dehydrogenase PdxA [Alteriqipengyuania sp. WL0013]
MSAVKPLAVSVGDPAGIGPELIVRSWLRRAEGLAPFAVVGGAGVLEASAASMGVDCPVVRIGTFAEADGVFAGALPVLDIADAAYTPGAPSPEGARLALQSLERAVDLACRGEAGGVMTAPIAKALLAEVGFAHPGQTEFCAAACGVAEAGTVMMLAGPSLRTVPVTIHCALAEVPQRLSAELIVSRARITAAALAADFGIARPRLAVTGLNPHAGENGRMGREEIEVIAPAIADLRAEGIEASGPHPADAIFTPRARDGYDAAICMYHDQALVPLKALDFDAGVNVTLGLPIVRTSPDHGTGFDIAGKGIADEGATMAALRLAGEIAARRRG